MPEYIFLQGQQISYYYGWSTNRTILLRHVEKMEDELPSILMEHQLLTVLSVLPSYIETDSGIKHFNFNLSFPNVL